MSPRDQRRRSPSSRTFRRWAWLFVVALVAVSLVRNAIDEGPPRTSQDRVRAVAATIRCPTCSGQSVADSDSAAARSIRTEVASRVERGESADEIRSAIASTYGDDVLLTPGASGMEGLVWILPVLVLVLALAALSATLARWRRAPMTHASDADRALVDEALSER